MSLIFYGYGLSDDQCQECKQRGQVAIYIETGKRKPPRLYLCKKCAEKVNADLLARKERKPDGNHHL